MCQWIHSCRKKTDQTVDVSTVSWQCVSAVAITCVASHISGSPSRLLVYENHPEKELPMIFAYVKKIVFSCKKLDLSNSVTVFPVSVIISMKYDVLFSKHIHLHTCT